MISVNLIGAGRVGFHLAKKLSACSNVKISQIYSRSKLSDSRWDFLPHQVEKISVLDHLKPSDISLICVSDNAIKEISEHIPFEHQLVIHTSGNTEMYALHSKHRRGVLYPVQSFSWDKSIDWENVPIGIETEFSQDLSVLRSFAEILSPQVHMIDSSQRKKLHIAAVFANNFTNHMVYHAQEICKEHQIPFQLIQPLLKETFEKLQRMSAFEAQSGPALRGDNTTLSQHCESLFGIAREIYQIITKSIQLTYGKSKL